MIDHIIENSGRIVENYLSIHIYILTLFIGSFFLLILRNQ